MQLVDYFQHPGEHLLFLNGMVGQLESVLTIPMEVKTNYIALVGHPHSLQGGTMNNKVVTTLARTFKELGIPSLRFNFRGVGRSAGSYDAGIGESLDMLSLVNDLKNIRPDSSFIFAGFSFGSYVSYRAAAQCPHQALITVAPAIHHYNYNEFNPKPSSWLIIQGEQDEVVDPQLVFDFAQQFEPQLPVLRFADTTHYFHGKLIELRELLVKYLKKEFEMI